MRVPAGYLDNPICVVGLGYVGLTLAVALAEVGFRVHGVERIPHICDRIREGRAHFKESGIDARLAAQTTSGRLTVGRTPPPKGTAHVFIITVGTPLDATGKSNIESIKNAAKDVAAVLSDGDLAILRSTVRVGVSRSVVMPALDTAGVAYDLAFCPERTLEGQALDELRALPQVVGGASDASCLRAAQLFSFLTPTTVKVADLETAEMIKLVNNTQRDLMFAFANEVSGMCDALGISAREVIGAGNIGYPRAAMAMPGPVGGPCLEKDPYILAESVALAGGSARLALLGRTLNEELPIRVAELVNQESLVKEGERSNVRIALVGLAFKGRPETSDLRGTLAIPLISALRERAPNATIVGYDPALERDDFNGLGIEYCASAAEAFQDAAVVIFQNNNARFQLLDLGSLSVTMVPGGLIYDLWNQFSPDPMQIDSGVRYCALGSRVDLKRTRSRQPAVGAA